MTRVAVVTGGNKGIGFAIVKLLCKKFDGVVYLTARDIFRGQKAIKELEKEGLKPRFHQLDITDEDSISTFCNYLKRTYKGLDVLVNNAGIAFKRFIKVPSFYVQAKETLRVNYFGLRKVCKKLYPLLKPHARVVHVSSSHGHLSKLPDEELKRILSNPNLKEEELDDIMNDFIEAARVDRHLMKGWAHSAYVTSKIGVSTLARIHQTMFNSDTRKDLVVNAVHPGFVATDLTSHKGNMTPDEGAEAPVYAALLPANTNIKGKYIWHDKSLMEWSEYEFIYNNTS